MSYSMTYSLAGIKILICLYLGSWISYRKVFVIQTKLWTSPFQTIMSQLSSMFVARTMKQKLRRIFFETPSKVSGGCLAGFGKWSRRCPEGVWDVSNILDYLRQFSYTALSKLGLQLVLDASQAAINKRPSLFSVAGTTKCRGRFENSGFWLVRTLVMLHVPDLDRPIRGRAYSAKQKYPIGNFALHFLYGMKYFGHKKFSWTKNYFWTKFFFWLKLCFEPLLWLFFLKFFNQIFVKISPSQS